MTDEDFDALDFASAQYPEAYADIVAEARRARASEAMLKKELGDREHTCEFCTENEFPEKGEWLIWVCGPCCFRRETQASAEIARLREALETSATNVRRTADEILTLPVMRGMLRRIADEARAALTPKTGETK